MDQKSSFEVDGTTMTDKPQGVNKRGSNMATIEDDDERLLNRIGYTQVRLLYTLLNLFMSTHHSLRIYDDISQNGLHYPMPSPFLVCWDPFPLPLEVH